MNFEAIITKRFEEEFSELEKNTQKQLYKKIELAELYPFKNKALTGFNRKIFRIRFKDLNIEKRAIYIIDKSNILFITIIERKHNYRELKNILEKLGLK